MVKTGLALPNPDAHARGFTELPTVLRRFVEACCERALDLAENPWRTDRADVGEIAILLVVLLHCYLRAARVMYNISGFKILNVERRPILEPNDRTDPRGGIATGE